eukprot:EG_transcript_25186
MFNIRQDWEPVVIRKAPAKDTTSKEQKVNQAIQSGQAVESASKFGAGGNKQSSAPLYARKLDEDTENLRHQTVNNNVRLAIQKGRTAKGWKQSDLGQQINEKPSVIAEYETGKAIPNQQVLGKMERALGIKLRGKDIGEPLEKKKPEEKKEPAPAPAAKKGKK